MYKSYILSNVIFIEIGCNGMDILILKVFDWAKICGHSRHI